VYLLFLSLSQKNLQAEKFSQAHMSDEKVRKKDLCWYVRTIYDTRELPGVNTAGSGVDGVLHALWIGESPPPHLRIWGPSSRLRIEELPLSCVQMRDTVVAPLDHEAVVAARGVSRLSRSWATAIVARTWVDVVARASGWGVKN
jgi:hypothetical protein